MHSEQIAENRGIRTDTAKTRGASRTQPRYTEIGAEETAAKEAMGRLRRWQPRPRQPRVQKVKVVAEKSATEWHPGSGGRGNVNQGHDIRRRDGE